MDWEKMEAVMLVLARNLQTFESAAGRALRPLWVSPWFGCQKDSYRGVKLRGKRVEEGVEEEVDEEKRKLREEDPYNVSGSWMRVCSLLSLLPSPYFRFLGISTNRAKSQGRNVPRLPRALILQLRTRRPTGRPTPTAHLHHRSHPSHYDGAGSHLHQTRPRSGSENARGEFQGHCEEFAYAS